LNETSACDTYPITRLLITFLNRTLV